MSDIRPGVLLIETSLEGYLIDENYRRTQADTILGLQKNIDKDFAVYYERVQSLDGLRQVISKCKEQNCLKKTGRKIEDGRVERTNIEFVHISSHGLRKGLCLSKNASSEEMANQDELVDVFANLKGSKVKAVILSACNVGQNADLAEGIIKFAGVKAVIGYPNTTYDHICSIAEQLLYYQLLRNKRIHVYDTVRRVNDCLFVLGENVDRLMVCWEKDSDGIIGPHPWFDGESFQKNKKCRSYISWITATIPHRGRVGEKDLQGLREILTKWY